MLGKRFKWLRLDEGLCGYWYRVSALLCGLLRFHFQKPLRGELIYSPKVSGKGNSSNACAIFFFLGFCFVLTSAVLYLLQRVWLQHAHSTKTHGALRIQCFAIKLYWILWLVPCYLFLFAPSPLCLSSLQILKLLAVYLSGFFCSLPLEKKQWATPINTELFLVPCYKKLSSIITMLILSTWLGNSPIVKLLFNNLTACIKCLS